MPIPALTLLLEPPTGAPPPLIVLAGDEPFLKQEVLSLLRRWVCGGETDGPTGAGQDWEIAWSSLTGADAEWADVWDSLTAVSLFGSGVQAVLIDEADPFVTAYRARLEGYLSAPPVGAVLVLDVKAWSAASRLAKAAEDSGLVVRCQPPDRGKEVAAHRRRVKQWLAQRAERLHRAELAPAAAELLLELLPLNPGVLDQEVARLALLAGGAISPGLVREHVGGWRAQKAWDMIDAMADGDAAGALSQLDRLLLAGEQPIGLLAQVSSSMRRFAAAEARFSQAQVSGRPVSLRQALEQAGVVRFKLGDAERQLKQIGRSRASELERRLLAADLAMKAHNAAPGRARLELERMIVWLSRSADPRR